MDAFTKFTDPLHGDCSFTSMSQIPKGCTVSQPGGQVHIVDQGVTSDQCREANISEPQALIHHLNSPLPEPTNRMIFISQKNPRSPLDITVELLEPIIDHYRITPVFLDLMSFFTRRVIRTEDGFCSPVRTVKGENTLELCYMYKYAELKPTARTTNGRDPWEIRKTGVYHRIHLQTKKSIFIILSPMPATPVEMRLRQCLRGSFAHNKISASPFYVHSVLISCYITNWRQYCTHYELALGKVSGKVKTIDLGSDFDISHETLRETNNLKQKLLPLPSIFVALNLVLSTLERAAGSLSSDLGEASEDIESIQNLHRDSISHSENARYLLKFSDRIRMQTSDALSLNNQGISVQQSNQLFKLTQASASDSLSIRIITILTLIYLPFSFVASLMSMCFFEMDTSNHRIIVSSQIWVFFCISLPLASFTLILWRWIMLRRFPLLWNKGKARSCNSPEKLV